MRTTVDLPDELFRRTKALAAMRGSSLKELIIQAVEKEVASGSNGEKAPIAKHVKLPLLHLRRRRKLDLTGFNFDDLLT